ncbi:LAME_0H16160g1_1 [Lachancea meyersii CBS 8951]|uniref:LAME_0H16160g1_1 n=1 Tax=Lachancea meyersii CBS 8951 TaxID=1266667 RepID=A0A1G4KHW2_9SACH|nr:LAME_0H16160g1_1 [Lachancea meyersii CBS 8951]
MSSQIIPIKDQAALVLEDGKIYKIQHRRQRKILSCVACHKRKIKCTRETPSCSICLKKNIECHYFVNDRVSRGGSTATESLADNPDAVLVAETPNNEDPAEKKEQLLRAIEKAKSMAKDEQKLLELKRRQKKDSLRRKQDAETARGTFEEPLTPFQPGIRANELPGHRNFRSTPTGTPSIVSPMSNSSGQTSPCPIFGKDLRMYLPSRQRASELFETYHTTVHPIIPLINIPTFMRDLELFWMDREQGGTGDTEFLLILFPVLYAASKSQFHHCNNSDTLFAEMSIFFEAANVLYTLYDFPNTFNINMITGSVLINSVIENPSITAIAQLSRLAQRILLTRDPASYHQLMDPEVIQSRRILFWQVFQLDTMTSLYNNLPPLIKLDDFDTARPAEVINGEINPSLCLLNAKHRFVILLNELCSLTNRGNFQGLKERIVDLHVCCMGSALSLRNHGKHVGQQTAHEAKFIDWAVFMLNTFADRACLLLHLNIIKTSLPMLMKRRRLWKQEKTLNSGTVSDPIAESGYGKNFLTIQAILNDSGNLTLDHTLREGPDGLIDTGLVYDYEDLTNNLIPASLHYLDEFLKYHTDDTFSCYNWELLVGNMPINAITFAIKTLALDLNRAQQMDQVLVLQTDLRYILLSRAIPLAEMKVDSKTAVCKNCFQLIKLLFKLIIVKHGKYLEYMSRTPIDASKVFHSKYDTGNPSLNSVRPAIVPQPSVGLMSTTGGSSANSQASNSGDVDFTRDANRILSITSIINGEDFFNDRFSFSGNLIYNNNALDTSYTTSCAQIAPSTMRTLAATPQNLPIYPPFGDIGFAGTQTVAMDPNVAMNNAYLQTSYTREIPIEPSPMTVPATSETTAEPTLAPDFSNTNSVYRMTAPDCKTAAPLIRSASTEPQQEIEWIRQEVQRYILLLNRDRGEMDTIGTGDEYYREFENALLEIICGILSC